MKRTLTIIAALFLTFTLAACDSPLLSGLDGSGQTEIFSRIESENTTESVTETVTENGTEAESVTETVAENGTEAESVTEPASENITEAKSTPESVPEAETLLESTQEIIPETEDSAVSVTENGVYTTKEDVALYIHLYDHLPGNFITKTQARDLGWPGGDLEPYAPGKCIGGDRFGNYEGLLPADHQYRECDINTLGAKKRGAERLIYSTDLSAGENLIYYTGDHYESFTLLYGVE